MIKYFKIALIIQGLFLLNSCYNKESVAGEYSGMSLVSDFDITLNEDGTWKRTDISNGSNPFEEKGTERTSSGTWKCNMDYFTSCSDGKGKGTCRKLRLRYNNGGKSHTYDVREEFFGWKFVLYADGDVISGFD